MPLYTGDIHGLKAIESDDMALPITLPVGRIGLKPLPDLQTKCSQIECFHVATRDFKVVLATVIEGCKAKFCSSTHCVEGSPCPATSGIGRGTTVAIKFSIPGLVETFASKHLDSMFFEDNVLHVSYQLILIIFQSINDIIFFTFLWKSLGTLHHIRWIVFNSYENAM